MKISKRVIDKHIADEHKDRDTYRQEATDAANQGHMKVANTLQKISKEEAGHANMLDKIKGKGMKSNPSSSVLNPSPNEINLGSQGSGLERSLNQPHDSGMREHAQEALKASLETGLGDEAYRAKGGDKSTYSPDSSTGHVSRY